MKFSIVTATHLKNSFLDDLYQSLIEQTYSNWEWIIYLNNLDGRSISNKAILQDARVKIYNEGYDDSRVGFNKNKAFHLAKGDVLVEVDHDDILTSDCLEELYKAYQDPTVGFVYSDCAVWHMNGKFEPYGAAFGWTHKYFVWKDKQLISMNSFPPTSRSVAFIWYAPDHVRSWRKEVYREIGGHNPELSICDDHELMIRTYLKSKMHHVPKTLYIYRVTGENTWLERNKAIQETTVQLFNQHAWDLAVKEARERGLSVVEIGGGINPKPGCEINIDLENGNVKADLNDGIPLPDNSVGVLNASHIIEHLHDKNKIMSEIHRVLADGGWAFIEVPSTDGRGAFQDPTHVSYWNENSFWYYTRADKAAFIRNNTIRFQSFRLDTIWWDSQIAVTNAWLVAIKSEERRPHLKLI